MAKSLQTYLVDGDKGGVGKSLTTRALAHYFLSREPSKRPILAVFDADMSNPDVCGKDGLSTKNSTASLTQIVDLSIEQGWIEFANAVEKLQNDYEDNDIRIVVNMPAQIGSRAFQGTIPIVSELLRETNAFTLWLLSRPIEEGVRTLEERLKAMPARYHTGQVILNQFFGETKKFVMWDKNPLRAKLLADDPNDEFYWNESYLPEINDEVISAIGRTPFHIALGKNKDGKPILSHGFRLTLEAWLKKTNLMFSDMEEFIELDLKSSTPEVATSESVND